MKLNDLIPSPSTRAWLRQLYAVNPEAAGEVAWAIHEEVLEDMGPVELFAPCPTEGHKGRNIANHPCELCGHPQARLEDCVPVVSRWPGKPEERPGQLNLNPQVNVQDTLW